MILHIHVLMLTGIIAASFFAVRFRDLLAAVISLAIMSLLLSIEFYILQAPDVAITEAAVGAGLSTAVYVIAIKKCGRKET